MVFLHYLFIYREESPEHRQDDDDYDYRQDDPDYRQDDPDFRKDDTDFRQDDPDFRKYDHQCKLCPKSYTAKSSLDRHVKDKHPTSDSSGSRYVHFANSGFQHLA